MLVSLGLVILFQVTAAQVEPEEQASAHFEQRRAAVVDEDAPKSGAARPANATSVVHPRGMKRQKVWRSLASTNQRTPKNVSYEDGVAYVEHDIDTSALARRTGAGSQQSGSKKSALRLLQGNVATSSSDTGTATVFSALPKKKHGLHKRKAKKKKSKPNSKKKKR